MVSDERLNGNLVCIMADFNVIYPTIIKYEGYYVNDPADPGGETYMGVARNYNPTWPGWQIIDTYKAKNGGFIPYNTRIQDPTLESLVKAKAKEYFDKIQGTKIKSDAVAIIVAQVFWGTAEGIKQVVQRAAINLGAKIKADNSFGENTLKAINSLDQVKLYNEMKRLYVDYFTRLGKAQPEYASGWMNRVNYVLDVTGKLIKDNPKKAGIFFLTGTVLLIAAYKYKG